MDSEGAVIYSPDSWAALQEEGQQASAWARGKALLASETQGAEPQRGFSMEPAVRGGSVAKLKAKPQPSEFKWCPAYGVQQRQCSRHSTGGPLLLHTHRRDTQWLEESLCLQSSLERSDSLLHCSEFCDAQRKIGLPHSSMPPSPDEMLGNNKAPNFFPLSLLNGKGA